MSEETQIINRVANSPLITLDLTDFIDKGERRVFDLKDWLFQEMILKEKDFRSYVKEHDWAQYEGKHVALTCTADAIIPSWAYMLITTKLEPYAKTIALGGLIDLEKMICAQAIQNIDSQQYQNKKVVVKGCSDLLVPEFAYVEVTKKLRPVVSSIMYGEPCSTVPLYKKPKK
ncbi:DUF2480 family protein [Fulvivirga sediminis]|uniref:DUF2480 family protein n=1 Tax=Fulvivirga sediminis TaxID=2803949 RepID=A0A937FD76_9BACT|nr:DUF2480 family protein [Fulvivirga sediminis]MBL3659069.1 DUF2480 family protein [Fulvivirga sediminis]